MINATRFSYDARAIVALLLSPSLLFAQVSPERAAAQSMKAMAMHESEKLLQNLQKAPLEPSSRNARQQ